MANQPLLYVIGQKLFWEFRPILFNSHSLDTQPYWCNW